MTSAHSARIPHQGETELLTGNKAAAYGALISKVRCAPFFPITPQTEIMEAFAEWKASGVFTGEYREMESEHSVLSAAIGSALVGQRTFTGSSSQGLMLLFEMLPIASGNRLPIVMANVSRGLSAPVTLWSDHNDFLMTRDTGTITFVSETNQEILDSIVIAFRVSEDRRVLLPSMVNMDGFTHSFTREPVHIPSEEQIAGFLPELKRERMIDTSDPRSFGLPVMAEYMTFRQQVHKAMGNAMEVIGEAHRDFARITGRTYDVIDPFRMEGAKVAIVGMGANASIMKVAVNEMRSKGVPVGMVRPRLIRPFPYERLAAALEGVERVAVIDQNLSPGAGGILHLEVCKALRQSKIEVVNNYIAGLGGHPFSPKDAADVVDDLRKSQRDGMKWVV